MNRIDDKCYYEFRKIMVERQLVARGIIDSAVLDAMGKVLRQEFVPDDLKIHAYEDRPLPIGFGQTISQPYIVAYMMEALQINSCSKVLEIGAGAGYQSAILAEIVDEVHSVEIIEELFEIAKKNLERLNYHNVTVHLGDGSLGLERFAPYDAVIAACAADEIPANLIDQLKVDGNIAIPVGLPNNHQTLHILKKTSNTKLNSLAEVGVRFVPMIRQ